MKKITLFVLSIVFLTPVAQAQGIPVIDASSIAQLVIQAQQMAKDYEEFRAQTQALTGQLQTLKNVSNINSMQGAVTTGQQVMQQLQKNYGIANPTNADAINQAAASTAAVNSANNIQATQQNNLNTEAQRINDLAAQSQAALGTLQAQQAGNQINVELVQQLQLLRAQQLAQAQAMNAALLQQQQKDRDSAALTARALGQTLPPQAP